MRSYTVRFFLLEVSTPLILQLSTVDIVDVVHFVRSPQKVYEKHLCPRGLKLWSFTCTYIFTVAVMN
jgi:hypothetical protein